MAARIAALSPKPEATTAEAPAADKPATQTPSESPSTTVTPPEALREDMIANAVQFLKHPNVEGTPLARRVAFMKRKGMTSQEIDAALARAASDATSAPPLPPRNKRAVPAHQKPTRSIGWGGVAVAAAAAAVLGYGVSSYVVPWVRSCLSSSKASSSSSAAAAAASTTPQQTEQLATVLSRMNETQAAMLKSVNDLASEIKASRK